MEPDTVTATLDEIAPVVEHVRNGRMNQDGLYLCIVKAAFAKNFEFNRLVFRSEGTCDPFALNSSLRGLCEDIIGLKYIGTFSIADRNEAALLLANKQTFDFVQKQHKFFATYRPTQRVLGNNNLRAGTDAAQESRSIKRKLTALQQAYGRTFHRDFPTVQEMAESTGLLNLYKYLYAATSSFVHFSPRNLVRMGWGDIKMQTFEYSTCNFASYYEAFNRFYGLFLFVMFSTTFATTLMCRSDLQGLVDRLIKVLHDEQRWPELVTFEEMNWFDKGPVEILTSPFTIVGKQNENAQCQALWQ